MRPMDFLITITFVSMAFWIIWYCNIQLERLNKDIFDKTIKKVNEQLNKSNGFLRIFGLIIYSPYIKPYLSFSIFFVFLIILIII